MSEERRTITIVNERGLHARASAKLVEVASRWPETTDIRVAKEERDWVPGRRLPVARGAAPPGCHGGGRSAGGVPRMRPSEEEKNTRDMEPQKYVRVRATLLHPARWAAQRWNCVKRM